MNFIFGIQGDHVSTSWSMGEGEEEIEMCTVTAKKFCKKFFESSTTPIGLLPPAVRWVSPDRKTVVFERPPSVQYIEVAWAKQVEAHDARKYSWELPIPWSEYVVHFDSEYNPIIIHTYLRGAPLMDMSDHVCLMPMFNQYANSSLCKPVVGTWEEHPPTISWGVQEAYNMVWNSGFNLDLIDTLNWLTHYDCFITKSYSERFKRGTPRTKRRPSTGAVRPAPLGPSSHGDIFNALGVWQDLTLKDMLVGPHFWPSSSAREYIPMENFTIQNAVDEVIRSANAEGSSQEMISRLVSAFSSM